MKTQLKISIVVLCAAIEAVPTTENSNQMQTSEMNLLCVFHSYWTAIVILTGCTQVILSYSPSQPLTSEEKDVIWKFRFYLARDKRGLTKFLNSVTWRDPSEVKQAVEELLPQWTEIDTDDALELLGPGTVDSRVRAFAVKQLSRADDDVSVHIFGFIMI